MPVKKDVLKNLEEEQVKKLTVEERLQKLEELDLTSRLIDNNNSIKYLENAEIENRDAFGIFKVIVAGCFFLLFVFSLHLVVKTASLQNQVNALKTQIETSNYKETLEKEVKRFEEIQWANKNAIERIVDEVEKIETKIEANEKRINSVELNGGSRAKLKDALQHYIENN